MNTDLTPIELFLFDIALILLLARLFGAVAKRLGQPPVVGELIAGIALGPSLFSGTHTDWLFNGHDVAGPKAGTKVHVYDLIGQLTAIANVGLILFMFIVGYEVDRSLMRGREKVAASVSLGSIAIPMVGGTLLGVWLFTRHHDLTVSKSSTALFVGASMSVTAFPVLARILTDRGLHRTRIGGLAIASAAVDDIAAWSLLAVVVAIAGSDQQTDQWHILLSPVYLVVMAFGTRWLMRKVNERFLAAGRLTPDLLSIVVVLLLLSAFSTEWLGVHFIFGAFIMGACMPRENGEQLREAILERLEQLSVLVLLPVFFVVSGVKVDLSQVDSKGVVELLAILGVAIGGKFLGAYLGAKSVGVSGRQAGALATLMNTRGLTELVILTVGLQLKVLDTELFSLMVVMALVTTAMTGPLLRLIYPPRLIDRDIADAERAALSAGAAYRVLVVANSLDDTALIDTAIDIAAARTPSEVLIARMVPQQKASERLEVGSGLGAELLVMTKTLSDLHALAARGAGRGVEMRVHAKFSEDELAADLTRLIIEVMPNVVVLDADTDLAHHDFMPRIVRQRMAPPSAHQTVALLPGGGAGDAAAALQVAAAIARSTGADLVLVGKRERHLHELTRHGIRANVGEVTDTATVVGAVDEPGTHLVARARPDEEADTVDDWAGSLSARTPLSPGTK